MLRLQETQDLYVQVLDTYPAKTTHVCIASLEKNQPLLVSLDFRRHFSPVSIIFYSYLVITELFMEINTRKLKSAVGESQKNLKMQAKEGMCSTRSLLLMNLCLSQILETHPQRLSQRTWYVLHNPSNCFTNH